MRGLLYRIVVTCVNLFFPPLAVAMLAGWEWDCMVNSILFLCGVLPSHVHGFYISCVYFHRRHKVKKGRWPGGFKAMIHSANVLNGGASPRQAELLYLKEFGGGLEKKRSSRRNSHRARSSHDVQRRASPRPVSPDMQMRAYSQHRR